MKKKIKVLVIADNPFAPSGVGTQTKYMIEGLLKTGNYSFYCLAGAIKHNDYRIIQTEEYGEDFQVQPVDGYGTQELIREIINQKKPDILWFMTDPRFWTWLWEIDNEVRAKIPMVYYHVWDNYPYPDYNRKYYQSNDYVCTISKVTDDIVRHLAPELDVTRIPHTVNTEIFKKLDILEYSHLYSNPSLSAEKTIFFWNNRNARRKQPGSLMFWFKEFLDIVGHDKAALIMHTSPFDNNGQNLYKIINKLKLNKGQISLSTNSMAQSDLSKMYNLADCTINISDAEGFGLATLESLACETPIIVNMTGGLQEQVTNGKDWFGIGIEPNSKAVIGSQEVPYIYEDRISKQDFIDALLNIHNMSKEERSELGARGREYVLSDYGMEQYVSLWDQTLKRVHEESGSWENRKNYNNWSLESL